MLKFCRACAAAKLMMCRLMCSPSINGNVRLVTFAQVPALRNNLITSGLYFYLYNELSTITIKKTSATTQSVANTAKVTNHFDSPTASQSHLFLILAQAHA